VGRLEKKLFEQRKGVRDPRGQKNGEKRMPLFPTAREEKVGKDASEGQGINQGKKIRDGFALKKRKKKKTNLKKDLL